MAYGNPLSPVSTMTKAEYEREVEAKGHSPYWPPHHARRFVNSNTQGDKSAIRQSE